MSTPGRGEGTDRELYFAYGSNLSTYQMSRRCRGSRETGPAWLPGYRLSFAGYSENRKGGVATILPDEGGLVPGLLYEITKSDLLALDRYEGYPTHYDRRIVGVHTLAGEARQAWTYILEGQPFNRPSDPYLAILRAGHRKLGIDPAILLEALAEGD